MKVDIWIALAIAMGSCGLAACSAAGGGTYGEAIPANGVAAAPQKAKAHRLLPMGVSVGKFADPYGVGVDPRCTSNCDLYVADPGARTVWLVKPDGSRKIVADTSKLGGSFDPQGVAVSPIDGSVVIADKENFHTESIVWRIDPADGSATKLPGIDFRFGDSLRRMFARGVAVGPRGEVYVAMVQWNHLIDTGFGTTCTGQCPFSGLAQTGDSYGVAVDSAQNIYVSGTSFKIIFKLPSGARGFSTFLKVGDPYGVAVTWTGNHVLIADPGNKRVWYVRPDGTLVDLGGFADPYGVAVDGEGFAFVADAGSKDVWKIRLP
jgi:DNA-binding beta-propeller fold protein YncE